MLKNLSKIQQADSSNLVLDCVCKFFILVVATLILACMNDFEHIRLCSFFLLLVNAYLVLLNKNNRFALITCLFLLWFNYSIFYGNYFSAINSSFFDDAYTSYALRGFKIVLLFSVLLVLLCPSNVERAKLRPVIVFKFSGACSKLIPTVYLVVLTVIMLVGFGRPTASGQRGTPTAIYEYSIVLFIIGYYFFSRYRWYVIFSSVLLLGYCAQNMIFGGRITALQLLLIFFFFLCDGKKIKVKFLVPVLLIGLVTFSGIGIMRANFSFSLSNISQAIESIFEKAGTLDTAYSGYYTSLTFLKAESFTPIQNRLYMLWAFIKSIFLGGSVPDSNLARYTLQFYLHYEGGILPFFGEFYLGFFGIAGTSLMVAFYLRLMKKLNGCSSGLSGCVAVYIAATCPRWYLYSPSQMTRGVLLLCLVYILVGFACRNFVKSVPLKNRGRLENGN